MTNSYDIYQVDAFTTEVFRGNPAAVVPLQQWLSDEAMLNIAMENNLAETAFFIPVSDEEFDFEIRWFTPAVEVELCGHATLASCYVIWNKLGFASDEVRLKTRMAGPLYVKRDGEKIELNFPTRPVSEVPLPDGFEEKLGVKPVSYNRALKNLALLEDEQAVINFQPDMDYIAGLEGDGLIVTAKGIQSDCASRYFAPAHGIPEDPVTGSAHCSIIPFWADKLGKNELHARQVSARSGDLYCVLEDDRVRMSGYGKLFLEGKIFI
ncbi:PhzF family phenazine biosynthesis protein [Curvivirga aplysinae]|uniref:PhzF family phenazine biosynthesis protein n=1 Tax=Curvivirga aplysinae TaxID=2529852 RepID=UPI0012BD0098|nr:PhzF family phenazine biosynthesis protein [Curvivirga aplysinae]MTI09610.1 PhzF family phenazine biosynthesis protein [Curvivirga aplysinae]